MAKPKYKLTPVGEAYLKAAKDACAINKGIIIHKSGNIDITTITDEQAEALFKSGSPYVCEVPKKTDSES